MRHSRNDDYRELKREAKRQGIEVDSIKYNPAMIVDVPTEHKDKFDVIQRLGRTSFSNYGCMLGGDAPDKPWQLDIKKRAIQLMRFAARCRRENRNESGWRYEIEQRLFERFDIEVACSALDPGLSDLFSSRIEEPCLAPDSPTSGPRKRPDRIHGLQQTKNFDMILQSPYAHDDPPHQPSRLVEDVVKTTLNPDNGGSPLLFPFLILEAKREKGTENFEQMEIQTSFPIKHALQLQYDLLHTCGNTMDVPGGPLVWFLANRGEDWRVYAGHVQEREGRPKYLINFIWGGSITGIDDILQLILIVDFIVDWARDIFRPNILRQLRTLSTANYNDTMTFSFDPDVYSLQGEVQPWMEGQDIDPEELLDVPAADTPSESTGEDTSDPLDRFTTMHGVVRDARQIQSRLRGLIITRDNLETVLQSFENPTAATRFVRSIISLLSRRCVALDSEEVLDAVEDHWSGYTRIRPNRLDQKPKVYVQFRISFYINPVWEQVRELTYLAATDDARELLIQRAGIRSAPRTVFAIDDDGAVHEIEVSKVIIKQDKDKRSPGVQMQGTVHAIYEKHRIGNRDPSEPFLRASTRMDFEGRALWRGWRRGDCLPPQHRHLHKILVYSDVPDARYLPHGSRQKYCLYILDGRTDELNNFSVASKLIWALFREQIYSTVRKAKVPRNSRNWQDNRDGYCFSMESEKTQDFLGLSRNSFRQDVVSWIKATTGSEPSESTDQGRLPEAWYISKAAFLALFSSADTNQVCTIYGYPN
ncbi:hypothetical protein DL770_000199 [Monosporascus sp. CRB-9-2]|nr:hypothetical protein DL770_000199 [Monosporascus sp. CRB-9-2]